MKIGVIEHWRCGEPTGYRTLVWVPDEWEEEHFQLAVERAERAYIDTVKTYKDEEPPNDYKFGSPPYRDFPDRTVAAIDHEWGLKKAVYEAWDERRKRAAEPFGKYLANEGFKRFWDHDGDFNHELDWGHRHGLRLDYSETDATDLPGPNLPKPLRRRKLKTITVQ